VTRSDRGDPGAPARAGFVDLEGRLIGATGAPSDDGAPVLLLHPWVEVFPAGRDVYLLRTGDEPDVAIRDPAPEDRRLLEELAAGGTVGPGDPRVGRLDGLRTAGLVVERPARPVEPCWERFDRQLPYLAAFGDPTSAMERLRRARVCVIGCGAFTLVDDDTVEPSNLNRQVLYTAGDLGARKVERAAAWVRRFDPAIRVTAHAERVAGTEDAAAAIVGADAVVLAADWPPYELGRWVNAACVAARVPFVTAAQQPPVLRVGPTYVPGEGACFACHERELEAAHPLYRELAEHRRSHPTTAITLGPASGIVGTMLAMELLHLLTGAPVATRDRSLLVDMRTLTTRWEATHRRADCDVCG
jgi:molybdopterin/thiamine biosynthesis adenylyltransferase